MKKDWTLQTAQRLVLTMNREKNGGITARITSGIDTKKCVLVYEATGPSFFPSDSLTCSALKVELSSDGFADAFHLSVRNRPC